MKCHIGLITFAAAVVLAAPWQIATAQIPMPQKIPPKNFDEAKAQLIRGVAANAPEAAYFPGQELIINLKKGDRPLYGRVVWAFIEQGYLLLRPAPGVAPIRVDFKDIANVKTPDLSKVLPAKLNGKAGDIRPAFPTDAGAVPAAPAPEIRKIEIVEGGITRYQFVAPALSEKERDVLGQIAAAENRYAELLGKAGLASDYLRQVGQLAEYRGEALAGYYDQIRLNALGFTAVSRLYPYYAGYPAYIPVDPLYNDVGIAYGGLATSYMYGLAGYGGYGSQPANPVAGEPPDPVGDVIAQILLKDVSPAALADAHKQLMAARAKLGYYDRDGRLVAVRIDTGQVQAAAAPAPNGK